jgi:hypothetical protein
MMTQEINHDLSPHLLGGTEENHKKPQDGMDLNQAWPKCESDMPPLRHTAQCHMSIQF